MSAEIETATAREIRAESVSPRSASELAEILRDANERGRLINPIGGGTKQHIGNEPVEGALKVNTRELRTVHHYDDSDLTVSVGAGMTVADFQALLAEKRQFLPFDPMLPKQATIGGVLAANAFGPMKAGFGGLRDFCIGVEFATADGLVAKAGGRVVKNVAGYDLMKLMIGSYGTLGVITSANFKVHPRPERTTTFVMQFEDIAAAMQSRDRLRQRIRGAYMAMEIISPRAHEYLREHVARDPDHYAPSKPVEQVSHWSVALRVSGSERVVARYRSELAGHRITEHADDLGLWSAVSDFEVEVASRHRNAMVMYVSAPISEVKDVLTHAEAVAPEYTMLSASIGRITTGNLVVCFMPLAVDPPSAVAFANAVSALRGRVSRNVSVMAARCPEESKRHFDVWGGSPTDIQMMKAVRSAMDPKKILNRGRFIVG
jgi:glycolate oxidase FAD binding subunit